MYRITRNIDYFGDALLGGLFTAILVDNAIPACYHLADPTLLGLLDCPKYNGEPCQEWSFTYRPESSWDGRNIIQKAIDNFREDFHIDQGIRITRNKIPVVYYDIPGVPAHDVALVCRTSNWTPYRIWPYFDDLKVELDRKRISWIDVTDTKGIECLNYVKRAKVFVGLESGASHYVSSVVNRSLIIQSGYSNINYWSLYGYDYIDFDCSCRNCFLRNGCVYDHMCMKKIGLAQVLGIIEDKL